MSWTNLDANNTTLGSDYTNEYDPDPINFDINVSDIYVSTAYPTLFLNVISGVPGYVAVLTNDSNFADAWQPYTSSSIIAVLGADDDYNVSVGLRGFAANAAESWETIPLIKETIFPN